MKCQFCGQPVGASVNTCLECAKRMLEGESAPKTASSGDAENGGKRSRKSSGASPTELTLKECRRRGWLAVKTEYWQASFAAQELLKAAERGDDLDEPRRKLKKFGPGKRRDLFGFVDVLAIGTTFVAIQTTTHHGASSRVKKIRDECGAAAAAWIAAGGRVVVFGWNKEGNRWVLREREVTRDMLPDNPEPDVADAESEFLLF